MKTVFVLFFDTTWVVGKDLQGAVYQDDPSRYVLSEVIILYIWSSRIVPFIDIRLQCGSESTQRLH